MPRMSFIWQYTLSTLSVEGVGKVSRSDTAECRAWCPFVVDGSSDGPGLSSGLGGVDSHNPLQLERGLVAV
jgi:hypothetical protein